MKRPGVGRRDGRPRVLRRHGRVQSPAPRVIGERARPYGEEPDLPFRLARQRALAMFERFYLFAQLRRYKGSIEHMAQHAGVTSKRVRSLMKRHGIARIWPVT